MESPIDERLVRFNLLNVEEFILFCKNNGIKIIILEGTYNPEVFIDEHGQITQFIREKLEVLARRHENTEFIPLTDQYQLGPSDWQDPLHIKKMADFMYRSQFFNNYLIPYTESVNK